MDKAVSIVIRAWNEKASLAKLLEKLKEQRFDGEKEIIVVDNESTDGTKELAENFGAKVVTIKRKEFTYPKSMNFGVAASRYPIVILTVGHALPLSDNWLETAVNHFYDPRVAGVYSPVIPKRKHSLGESLLYYPGYFLAKIKGPFKVYKTGSGVLGATNCAIRKDLWKEHNFDENYELGGEDTWWADWATKKGYYLICDTRFAVVHSHQLDTLGVLKQLAYWKKLRKATKFNRKELDFRPDLRGKD